jgi:hypothetical protein
LGKPNFDYVDIYTDFRTRRSLRETPHFFFRST